MTINEDFKQALKEGKFNEALAIAVSKAPELKITTTITPSTQYSEVNNNLVSETEGIKRLHTRINLVEGEIHNEISEELVGNVLYQEIQQFHFEQVAKGHQTIQKNLESLQNMFSMMTALQKSQLSGDYQDINYLATRNAPLLSQQTTSQTEPENQTKVAQQNLLAVDNGSDSPPTIIQTNGNSENEMAFDSESIDRELENEEWGEWLEEGDDPDLEVDLLDLSSLDLDEPEQWGEWEGEETQLFAGAPATSSEDNKDN